MRNPEIVAQRLVHQAVGPSDLGSPHEVIKWMGAVQAQDYRSSLWAVGLRMAPAIACNEATIEQAFAERKIVRTWPMRGTLHWVAAEDIRWMLALLTPRVIKSSQGRYKQLELDEKVFAKSRDIFERKLQGGNTLTRSELYQSLHDGGISPRGQRGIHLIGHWAMAGLLCQAPKKDKQDTFALLDEWLPGSKARGGEEALSTLTERYIKSRGPATEYDFANWAGLKATDARRGFEMVAAQLEKTTSDGVSYWFAPSEKAAVDAVIGQVAWLLPAFDEMLCGYKDRSALLDSAEIKSTVLKNGIFKPIVLLDNRAAGTWQRTIKASQVRVTFSFFRPLSSSERQHIIDKAMSLEKFFGKEVVVDF